MNYEFERALNVMKKVERLEKRLQDVSVKVSVESDLSVDDYGTESRSREIENIHNELQTIVASESGIDVSIQEFNPSLDNDKSIVVATEGVGSVLSAIVRWLRNIWKSIFGSGNESKRSEKTTKKIDKIVSSLNDKINDMAKDSKFITVTIDDKTGEVFLDRFAKYGTRVKNLKSTVTTQAIIKATDIIKAKPDRNPLEKVEKFIDGEKPDKLGIKANLIKNFTTFKLETSNIIQDLGSESNMISINQSGVSFLSISEDDKTIKLRFQTIRTTADAKLFKSNDIKLTADQLRSLVANLSSTEMFNTNFSNALIETARDRIDEKYGKPSADRIKKLLKTIKSVDDNVNAARLSFVNLIESLVEIHIESLDRANQTN